MSQSLEKVPIIQVIAQPQARKHFDDASIQGLAESIREVGLQQPLIAIREGGQFILIDGERRLRACQRLGMSEVPVLVVKDAKTIGDMLITQLTCNLQREDLTPIDRAVAIRHVMEKNSMSGDEVAKRLGLSPATVSRTLSVLSLPEALREQVARGAIPADIGYLLTRVEEPAKQADLAAEVAAGRLSRDSLTRKLKRVRRAEECGTSGRSRITALLGEGRSVTLVGNTLTLDALIEMLDILLSRARKSKSQGLTLETFVRALRDQATSRKAVAS